MVVICDDTSHARNDGPKQSKKQYRCHFLFLKGKENFGVNLHHTLRFNNCCNSAAAGHAVHDVNVELLNMDVNELDCQE